MHLGQTRQGGGPSDSVRLGRRSLSQDLSNDAVVVQSPSLAELTLARQPSLQLIYETAPIGLAFLSPDCRYLQINQRLTEICGISVEGHIGRSVRECVPALADSVKRIVDSIMETGEPVTGVEVAGQRPGQNEDRYWITYWHPMRGPAGEIVGVNVAAEEITERKRAEAALQASERQFHTLADAIPQLVWMADAHGAIFWLNNRWYEYTGRPPDDVASANWRAVLGHRWIRALETGTALEMELSLLGKDGLYRPFLTRIVPLRDSTDTVYGWIGTHIDIGERKRHEQELRRAKEAAEAALRNLQETQNSLIEAEKLAALGRLVSGVAHEINSPVGVGLTVVSALERKIAEFSAEAGNGSLKRSSLNDFLAATRDASSQLLANLNRAAELIQSFKQVAADRTQSDQRRFDVGELTEQAVMSMRPGLRRHKLTLNVSCEPHLTMNSYPGAYGQALTNLFLNSVTHAFPDGKDGIIDIKVQAAGKDEVKVVFSDNGCGMSFSVKRQAFNPFFTTRRDQGCTGLGLHIVHDIVTNRLGGRLNLESEPGKGTMIQLILPRVAPADLAAGAHSQPH